MLTTVYTIVRNPKVFWT